MSRNGIFVSWFIRDIPRPEGGGGKSNCSWDLVLAKLRDLQHEDGSVTLEYDDGRKEYDKSLSVHAQNDHYFIVFNDTENGQPFRRVSFDENIPWSEYEMQGADWDARIIFTDYELVYDVFKQFFDTLNIVSPRLYP
ncbi:hypothetical protein RNI52_30630 [Labrys neptuniae]|uniref:Uncharacterized protein n=1 Tax=Labrys neptuniae TaxID=376174 RepID=A0ABV3PY22_9HYPH|nr:hypothetical protein [Labrys neptuniae]MDT3381720.1 hypothetical protein [Labrys neptuniae]